MYPALCLLAPTWPCQVDCPDDVASYIHRVGRTARYTASGRSLLLLTPSEKAMLPLLEAAKIPFQLTKVSHRPQGVLRSMQGCRGAAMGLDLSQWG